MSNTYYSDASLQQINPRGSVIANEIELNAFFYFSV